MVSLDGSGLPLWLIALVLAVGALCYLGTGILSELTWRNATLKDLEIIRRLRETPTDRKAFVSVLVDDYEKKVLKRLDARLNGKTAVAVTVGVLVRAVPAFALTMVIWPLYVLYGVSQGWQMSVLGLAQSLFTWFIGGLMLEGLFSVMKPFVKPLSERWNRVAGGGDSEGQEDAGDVPRGKEG